MTHIHPFRLRLLFTLALLAMLMAACGSSEESKPIAVAPEKSEQTAVTRVTVETVVAESEPLEVESNDIMDSGAVANRDESTVEYEAPMEEAAAAEDAYAGGPTPLATAPSTYSEPMPQAPPPSPTYPTATFFEDYGVNPFVSTAVDDLSTFSLDVDTGSYSIARRYLQDGLQPPPDAIRVEEFVNAFDQGYEAPRTTFAVYADGAPSPFHDDGTYFLRIGIKGFETDEEERPSAALTFVIDVSGSMAQENRLELVKQSLQLLVDRMRADDTIAIVVYGSNARIVLPPTNGSDQRTILNAIYSLEPEGSTNLEAGLMLGYQQANVAYKANGINRVIIASDGVANVGNTSADQLAQQIRGYADSGIQLTTIGFGLGNYNDVMMEQLADQGDGAYAYIDTLDEARELFVENIMSTLQTIALDAKIQVEFDRNVVQQYRLIGYENRAIADQDFRNDAIDAAEFGAGHAAAAIYAIQLVPGANGRIATVNLRWQDPQTRAVQEISGVFGTENLSRSFDDAPLHYQLAVVVSQYAELLRGSYWTYDVNLNDVTIRADRLASQLGDPNVYELAQLIHATR